MTSTFKMRYRKDEQEYKNSWLTFYPKKDSRGFCFSWRKKQIHTYVSSILTVIGLIFLPFFISWWTLLLIPFLFFSWGQIFINLPKYSDDDWDSYDYGVDFYSVDGEFPNHIWFRMADGKSKTFYFPWAYKFDKREVLHKLGWYTEQKGDNLWDKDVWGNMMVIETHPYTYTLNSGEKQKTTAEIYQEKRTWKNWFGLNKMMKHYIEIEFKDEVGERAGSWKGGCVSCSYQVNKGETALECLRRMEKERRFR